MPFRLLALILSFLVLTGAAAAAGVRLGDQKYFGDWAVACDNGLSCESVSLFPENGGDGGISVLLSRESGNGKLRIALSGFDSKSGRYRISVDRRAVANGSIIADDAAPVVVRDEAAIKVARAMAKGRTLLLSDERGTAIGSVSLNGSKTMLAYIDRTQGLAGTRAALTIAGKRAARGKSVSLPVIEAKRVRAIDSAPDAAAMVALAEGSSCATERRDVTEDSAYSLGRDAEGRAKALVLISCGNGAYNFASAIYIATESAPGKWSFAPAGFDYGGDLRTEDKQAQLLINAGWDASTQTLSHYNKGRGLGDCGLSARYIWDGSQFRLKAAEAMDQCRGALDWPTLWRADVKLVD